jgi:hypothetical protein
MSDEQKWAECRSVGMALQLLNRTAKSANRGWRRKFRLCGCYLLRRLEAGMPDDRFTHALNVAERHFEGDATRAELQAAIAEAQRGYEVHRCDLEEGNDRKAKGLSALLNDSPLSCVSLTLSAAYRLSNEAGNKEALALLRELFGNPYRPAAVAPEWRTDTALALSRAMYDSRDFGAMPILADALQDAGCDNEDVLSHCRDAGAAHVRGCWVVDLVLGKA